MITIATMLMTTLTVGQLSDRYLNELWKSSPTAASQAGYHKDDVDKHLDNLSSHARQDRVAVLDEISRGLVALPAASLNDEDAADAALMHDAIALERLELTEAQDFKRRADEPMDALGSVFFVMQVRKYAPDATRAEQVLARLHEVPRYLQQAAANLTVNVPVFVAAAKDDGQGLVDYFRTDLPATFASTPSGPAIKKASSTAAAAVTTYLKLLDDKIAKLPPQDFRYDKALYEKRFGPYLQTDLTTAQVLAQAEARLRVVQADMKTLAQKIIGRPDVKAALDNIAADHPRADQLFDVVRATLKRARTFIAEKGLLTLNRNDNLQVIETPVFLRSMLGVAAFDGAPPLDPKLGAFYYVTPFDKSWPAEKAESKLREYNNYMLELLTIHEAMPGHYVQFEHANDVQPETRRVLRWMLGAGSYIEGWAVYTQDMMVDAGYLNHDPKLALQARKLELRAIGNAILDIKLHTQKMSDADAMKLMLDETYQEKTEAEQKLRRAKLSVTQLCSYFVGGEAWRVIRQEAGRKPGFSLKAFHDRALADGAVTLPTLRKLLAR